MTDSAAEGYSAQPSVDAEDVDADDVAGEEILVDDVVVEEVVVDDVVVEEIDEGDELEDVLVLDEVDTALELPVWEPTGEPRVDAALDLLATLDPDDVHQHAAVFDQVHEQLRATLSDVDGQQA